MQAVKFRSGQQLRRDSISTQDITFNKLLAVFNELFQRSLQHETLRYLDDAAEWVDISSDRELQEALRLKKNTVLEFQTVRLPPSSATTTHEQQRQPRIWQHRHQASRREERPLLQAPVASPSDSDRPLNGRSNLQLPFRHHAICDSCNTNIVGNRHKCSECLDYDLCSSCIERADSIHPNHTWTVLARSYPRWHHRRPEIVHQEPPHRAAEETKIETAPTIEPPISKEEIVDRTAIAASQPEPVATIDHVSEEAAEPVVSSLSLNGSRIVEAIKTLSQMGFTDKQKNVRLLLSCSGDISQVAELLLEEQASS